MKSRPPARRPFARTVAVLAAGALVLAACGGDDEPVADPDQPPSESPVETRPPVDGPTSTLSPDIPDAFDGQIGPVDVIGDPLPPLQDEASDPAIGMQAPVLVGEDLDGRAIRIDPAADGPTMLVFAAHWCPHCNDELPKLERMRVYGQFPEGLHIVGVSTAVAPDRPNFPVTDWLRNDMEWKWPAMLDGIDMDTTPPTFVAAEAYGVTGFPMVVLVAGDGTVVDRWSGERPEDEIIARIDQLGLA